MYINTEFSYRQWLDVGVKYVFNVSFVFNFDNLHLIWLENCLSFSISVHIVCFFFLFFLSFLFWAKVCWPTNSSESCRAIQASTLLSVYFPSCLLCVFFFFLYCLYLLFNSNFIQLLKHCVVQIAAKFINISFISSIWIKQRNLTR